jgi:NADH-quinone oxidoreductase subunit A
MASPTAIVGYLALFVAAGFSFLFINLLVGKLLRPSDPSPEKQEIYECGEPTIGSSFVQFDIRFYVVALLFIIFDVEIAFFFPWATVFGKAAQLANSPAALMEEDGSALTPSAEALVLELGVPNASVEMAATGGATEGEPATVLKDTSRKLAIMSFADIAVFFAVLMVGFAYVWKRGDLDWVRAVSRSQAASGDRGPPSDAPSEEPVLSA